MALEYFEEYGIGVEFATKARTITEADIVEKNNRHSYG